MKVYVLKMMGKKIGYDNMVDLIRHLQASLTEADIEGNFEDFSDLSVSTVEMTREKFDSLGDFEGWGQLEKNLRKSADT